VDKNGMKKDKGEVFGMTHFINPDDHKSSDGTDSKSISAMVKDLTGGAGVDYCFECSGVPNLINQALEATKVVMNPCHRIIDKITIAHAHG